MANELKAGDLDPPTDSGFTSSMAEAMETALNALLSREGKPTVPVDNSAESRDRRIMFLAIAQGIVNHLVGNQAAFRVKDSNNDPTSLKIEIVKE